VETLTEALHAGPSRGRKGGWGGIPGEHGDHSEVTLGTNTLMASSLPPLCSEI
jgi:hypothetical protein